MPWDDTRDDGGGLTEYMTVADMRDTLTRLAGERPDAAVVVEVTIGPNHPEPQRRELLVVTECREAVLPLTGYQTVRLIARKLD